MPRLFANTPTDKMGNTFSTYIRTARFAARHGTADVDIRWRSYDYWIN
jgi:hypothetical protein